MEQFNKITSCSAEMEKIQTRAKSLLVIVPTPPTRNYENFTTKVNEFNAKEPFYFTVPSVFKSFEKVNYWLLKETLYRTSFLISHLI